MKLLLQVYRFDIILSKYCNINGTRHRNNSETMIPARAEGTQCLSTVLDKRQNIHFIVDAKNMFCQTSMKNGALA